MRLGSPVLRLGLPQLDLGLPVPTQRLPGTLIDVIADRGAPAPKDHVGLALDPSGRIVWLDG